MSQKVFQEFPQVILSPKAAEVFQDACKAEGKDMEKSFLRIGARPGGCSGWKYEMEWNGLEDVKDQDVTLKSEGVQIVVDLECLREILGPLKVDYSESNLVEQGFVFRQLINGHQCGCGESFSPVRDLKERLN